VKPVFQAHTSTYASLSLIDVTRWTQMSPEQMSLPVAEAGAALAAE
jgi:hypothetical protein